MNNAVDSYVCTVHPIKRLTVHGHGMHLCTFLLRCIEQAFIDLQLVKYVIAMGLQRNTYG